MGIKATKKNQASKSYYRPRSTQNLAECKALYDELLQMDKEAYIPQKPLTEEEKHEGQ